MPPVCEALQQEVYSGQKDSPKCITAEAGPLSITKYNYHMLNRIFTGWTWIRAAHLIIGIWVIVLSAWEGEWIGIVLGTWPATMGLFGLACAGASCSTGACEIKNDVTPKK